MLFIITNKFKKKGDETLSLNSGRGHLPPPPPVDHNVPFRDFGVYFFINIFEVHNNPLKWQKSLQSIYRLYLCYNRFISLFTCKLH